MELLATRRSGRASGGHRSRPHRNLPRWRCRAVLLWDFGQVWRVDRRPTLRPLTEAKGKRRLRERLTRVSSLHSLSRLSCTLDTVFRDIAQSVWPTLQRAYCPSPSRRGTASKTPDVCRISQAIPLFFSRDTSSDLTYTPVGDSKAALYHDAATPKETDQTC